MSANHFQPHVLVLPEDDANRDIVIGFRADLSVKFRKIQVEDVAGGWRRVLELFQSDYLEGMNTYPLRFLVLLFDFDGHFEERFELARTMIPEALRPRVFVLGSLTKPEDLTASLGRFEAIGGAIAKDCRDGGDIAWKDPMLRHNAGEVERLRQAVRPILF
jgi:hypothetical protein